MPELNIFPVFGKFLSLSQEKVKAIAIVPSKSIAIRIEEYLQVSTTAQKINQNARTECVD
jgi:hypothetical protein